MGNELTERQFEALKLAAEGLTADESASRMHVTSATVRTYRTHTMIKLKAANMAQAVDQAYKLGIFRGAIRECPSCGFAPKERLNESNIR